MQSLFHSPGPQRNGAPLDLAAQPVLDAIFDQRLQQHTRQLHVQSGRLHILSELQLVSEADHLDRKIIVNKIQFFPQAAEIIVLPQQSPENVGQLIDYHARRGRISADKGGNRVQSVKQEVRVDLACQRIEPSLHQQTLLLLQFTL